jgi:hypothetical protein
LNLKIYSEGKVVEEKLGAARGRNRGMSHGRNRGMSHGRNSPQKNKKAKQQFSVTGNRCFA